MKRMRLQDSVVACSTWGSMWVLLPAGHAVHAQPLDTAAHRASSMQTSPEMAPPVRCKLNLTGEPQLFKYKLQTTLISIDS